MPSVGYTAAVKVVGTATGVTGEAFGGSGAGPYTISDSTKTVWDPSVTPAFKDNGVAIAAGDISTVDYLFGTVTFTGSKTGPITADLTYLPQLTVAEASSFDLSQSADLYDSTVFHATDSHRKRICGLNDATGSIGHIDDTLTDIDSGGGTVTWTSIWDGSSPTLLELAPTTSGRYWRGWVFLQSLGANATVDSLVEGSADFELAGKTAADGTDVAASWSS
jgi:hypothetical protein